MRGRAVVTGLGVVNALGLSKENFLKGLLAGRSGIGEVIHFNTDELFTQGGEVTEISDEGQKEDRVSIMLKKALKEALNDAALKFNNDYRIGAIVGTAQGGLKTGEKIHALYENQQPVPEFMWKEYPLNRLLYHIDSQIPITGPEVVISNACVSSTMALGVAQDILSDGLADIMIVAGVDSMTRFVSAGFHSLKAVTRSVCRPFDKNRDGIIPGEGAGVVILEREDVAMKRGAKIRAELAGFGSASDAVHMTAPDREGSGAYYSIQMALKQAGITPQDIDYIIPHGTGTGYNDEMEYTALSRIFGEEIKNKPVSSIKSTIGHTMGAAGIMSAIAAVLAIEYSFLPVNLNYQVSDEKIPLNVVKEPGKVNENKHVLIMTSAFGGSNAVAIFSKPGYHAIDKEGLL